MHELRVGPAVADVVAPYVDATRASTSASLGRPWVLANMVATVDGRASVGGRVGSLSGGTDAVLFRALRTVADVVLVGARTVRAEGYGPAAGRPVAVVSRSLDLDLAGPLFRDAAERTIVVTCASACPDRVAAVGAVADVVVAGESSVDVGRALDALGERGHRVVLCEGGPRLLGDLIAADRLDELCLTVAPLLGGDPLPTTIGAGGSLRALRLAHVLADDDGTLFLRYRRRRDG